MTVWRNAAFGIACLSALIVAIFSSACGGHRAPARRVIVLGFDGMDYRVTRDLMTQGRMPNFSRLAASGTFSPLATSSPAQSPVAWSTFITGLSPAGHAIFDFVHRDPATMEPYLSTTRTEAPSREIGIGSWRLPLSSASVTLLREGQPFWELLESGGVPTTIMRMPANFPPSGTASRELSGMGTPDVLGTYGTFSFFTSSPDPTMARTLSGGRVYVVDVVDNVVRSEIPGPENPFRRPGRNVTAPFAVYVDAREDVAKIAAGGEERVLAAGEWSDWVPIHFPLMPTQQVHGMVRFYLKRVRPSFEMYVSPVNFDPMSPAMTISTPASFAADLAQATGRYYTQGIPEDTKALTDRVLSRDEFLQQASLAGAELAQQYLAALDTFTEGVLFCHFGNLDQVSHMMWRARDPGHPAYDAVRDAPYAHVVDDLYVAFDRLLGETVQRAGPDATIIVMSDHGFASWRRSFSLNSWLRDHGYLAVGDSTRADDPGVFANVDWPRTRAYALGLNGLYLNLRGRERDGIVEASDRARLIEEIKHELLATIDPATGRAAITRVDTLDQIDPSHRHAGVAPDLIVGYAEGTRSSNESALGGVPREVIVNNTGEWSGDHCMDPAAVPGILLTSRPLHRPAPSLDAVAAAILAEFGITGFPVSR